MSQNKENKTKSWVNQSFIAGIGVLFPIFITLYLVSWIVKTANQLLGQSTNEWFSNWIGFTVPGIGLVIVVLLIFVTGLIYNYFFGKTIFGTFDRFFRKLPLVRSIYPSAKELSNFLFSEEASKKFKKAVSIEFPQEGTFSVGFITNDEIEELTPDSKEEMISVFVPLAPTPVSGHIILVPRSKVKELNISVDRAMTFIISGGVVLSKEDKQKVVEEK